MKAFLGNIFSGMAVLCTVMAILCLVFSGCPNDTTSGQTNAAVTAATKYTVTFDSHGGSAVQAVRANAGTRVNQPTAPIRTGYTFLGWYSSASGGTRYTWPYTVKANVTMHAQWRDNSLPPPVQYTVTFDSHGGSAVQAITVSPGTLVYQPTPTRTGYTFLGWFSAASGGAQYSWPYTVNANVTMHAQWVQPGVSVQINLQPAPDNPSLSNTSIFVDESASFTAAGTGYTEWKWYLEGSYIPGETSDTYILVSGQTPGIYELSVMVTTTEDVRLSARCRVTIKAR
jgi:uncharacterized repeat protein (TIGR02543 family)